MYCLIDVQHSTTMMYPEIPVGSIKYLSIVLFNNVLCLVVKHQQGAVKAYVLPTVNLLFLLFILLHFKQWDNVLASADYRLLLLLVLLKCNLYPPVVKYVSYLMLKPMCTPTCWRSLVLFTCLLNNTTSGFSIWWLKAFQLKKRVHFTSTMSWTIGMWLSGAAFMLNYIYTHKYHFSHVHATLKLQCW